MSSELEEKTRRLAAMLESEGLDAVLINSQHNFAWLTGGSSNGIDLSREIGAASLLVAANGKRYVLANNIEMPRMLKEEISAEDFEPVEYSWQEEKASGSFVIEKASSLIGGRIEADVALDAQVGKCRYQMTADEILRLRNLGQDAGLAVRHVISGLKTGETEREVAESLRHRFASGGMTLVVTLVAADERISEYRHPVPGDRSWTTSLLLVVCAKRRGLIVSLSRLIFAGRTPDELAKRTEAAAYVNACLLDETRPGATGAELYRRAANAYAEKGFANEINRHHQGGATGYKTREWVAHPQSTDVVLNDQAFAWNPSIAGTKVEDTCIASNDGIEIITSSPDFPQISTVVNGREYFSPGILSL